MQLYLSFQDVAMKTLVLAAVALPLSMPALAQDAAINPNEPAQSAVGVQTNGPTGAAPTSDPGQLDFGRTPANGVAAPGAGAGLPSNATGVPGTDDEYTRPIYGHGMR